LKRSLSFLPAVLASIALLRGIASCAEGSPKPEATADAGSTTDGDAVHPLETPDTGSPSRCQSNAWCFVDIGSAQVSLNGVWGSSATDVWIVGSPDTVLHWDGKALAQSKTDTRQTLFGIWGSGPADVWAYSTGDAIWHSDGFRDGGVVWSTADADAGAGAGSDDPAFTGAIASIWGRSANDVWAVGPFTWTPAGSLWHANGWSAGGPSWSPVNTNASDPSTPETISFSAIWGNAEGELWLVGPGGKTRHGTGALADGGVASWEAVNSGTSHDLFAVWGSGTEVWAAGAGGTMRRFSRSTDGSVTVTEVALPTTETIQSIFGFGPNDIWAAGTGATLLHYNGNFWTLVDVPVDASQSAERDLFSIWGSSPAELWVVGRNVLLHKGSADLPGRSQ
jgi:hypothetical protein